MKRHTRHFARYCLAVAVGVGVAVPALAGAQRVVSLNPCLDTILVHVADPTQIAGLSHYARDPSGSTIADVALNFPFTYETAEEIIALNPDLVLTSQHSSLATRNALNRLGVQTELFSVPETIADSLDQIRVVARLIGRLPQGEDLIARIEAALTASAPPAGTPSVTALVFQRNGFAAGEGTLVDEVMTRAGFVNVAGTFGLGKWGIVSLERVIANPPQTLLAGEVVAGTPTWAERVLDHPALNSIRHKMTRAVFPDRLLYCGGPVLIQSAMALATARQQTLGAAP